MDHPSGDPKEGDGVDGKDHSQGRLEGAPPGSVCHLTQHFPVPDTGGPRADTQIQGRQPAWRNPGAGGGTQLNQTHSSAPDDSRRGSTEEEFAGVRRGFSREVTFELSFSGYIKKCTQDIKTFL